MSPAFRPGLIRAPGIRCVACRHRPGNWHLLRKVANLRVGPTQWTPLMTLNTVETSLRQQTARSAP